MARAARPDLGGVLGQEREEIRPVIGAGVDVGSVEVAEGVDAGVVREVDGGGEVRVGGETRVLEDPTVEDEFEEKRVGSVPASGAGVGLWAETVVG